MAKQGVLIREMRKPRVLLAEEHELVLAGLRALLEPHYDLVGTANNGLSAAGRLSLMCND